MDFITANESKPKPSKAKKAKKSKDKSKKQSAKEQNLEAPKQSIKLKIKLGGQKVTTARYLLSSLGH